MAKTFNYWRELHKARLEAEELFRRKQIELIQEQILSGDDDPNWVHTLVETMKCAERIGRKLDEMADEDTIEMEEHCNAADAAFIGEASDTPDTRKKHYVLDPIKMINVEVEDYND